MLHQLKLPIFTLLAAVLLAGFMLLLEQEHGPRLVQLLFAFIFLSLGSMSILVYLLIFTGKMKIVPYYIFRHYENLKFTFGGNGILFHFLRYALFPIVSGLLILYGL